MMGGDEIFVAAHPIYSKFVCEIIAKLNSVQFKDRPLNMRTGVAYSRAPRLKDQKRANWEAHDQAHGLSISVINPLKALERAHRRLERLIEKLAANKKKQHLAPGYTKQLEALDLMRLFARSNHAAPRLLSDPNWSI